jgi:GNAT superfamily N-acetyltransferase
MLRKIDRFEDLDTRALMDIYAESNFENTDYFFPEEADKAAALRKVEMGFLDFLRMEFFAREGSMYRVLEENALWVSACRISAVRPGLFYLEALETRPDCRKQGCASRLLTGVLEEMKRDGPFRLCDCVDKRNTASLKTHEACGFRIVSEAGFDYLQEEADNRDYGLEYRYDGPETKKPETRLFAPITAEDDGALAQIVRHNLETHDLALPGTAYYDEQLDHLSGYYLSDPAKRFYLVLRDEAGRTLGGVGVAELPFFDRCGELQKLYLADEAKGAGLGYALIARIEDKARELGYRRIYLETHTNLRAAIHVYEKSGYRLIPRPAAAVHGTMDRFYIKEL